MAVHDSPPLNRFLRMALVAGVESAIRIHIDRGDDLNARDDKGQTPLMLSAARNRTAICKLLINAGADAGLLDPTGKDALGIAQAAGAHEAFSVIKAAHLSGAVPNSFNGSADVALISLNGSAIEVTSKPSTIRPDAIEAPQPLNRNSFGLELEITGASSPLIERTPDVGEENGAFDLAGWEAEEDQPPPADDPTLSEAALEIQSAISEHQPIDNSVDWEDFEAYLPERASPLPRADDAEARERLRLVLLRAIREGSVPDSLIEDLSLDDDGSPNDETGAIFRMVINDLGAETDERFEYSRPDESFEVSVAPEEAPDEEDSVADALAFIDDFAARRNKPQRIYQREFQREALLTAEAEVALGQAMERGVVKALDALASWPSGIGVVLDATRMVKSGAKSLRWMSSGPKVEPQDIETKLDAEPDADSVLPAADISEEDESDSQFDLDAKESNDESSDFFTKAVLLSALTISAMQGTPEWIACRSAVESLGLTRSFLLELADSGLAGEHEPALAFAQAMKTYRCARDRMTVANLKLVFSIAKKYLYSGQPLDDLLQEGNIGLIKAVDRYDWRRGFKFSTYATWWIRQQVGRHVADKSKTIRLPIHVYQKTQRIAQAAHAFELKIGRAPTVDEIAERVNLPARNVASLACSALEPLPIHELDVDDLIAVDAKDDFIARDPMDIVSDLQLIGSVDRLLSSLKLKDARVLRMRFGIGVNEAMTLEEIGVRLNLTRERIRQIEAAAIRHLKHPGRLERLLRELNGNPPAKRDEAEQATSLSDDTEPDGNQSTISFGAAARKLSIPKLSAPTCTRPERPQSAVTSALDILLTQAIVAGVTVDDDRKGSSGRIWVNITHMPDNHTRKLVRKLLAMGFKFWPGKGYWQ